MLCELQSTSSTACCPLGCPCSLRILFQHSQTVHVKKISICLSTDHISAYSSFFPIWSLKNTSRLSYFELYEQNVFPCTCPLLSWRPCTAVMLCHQNLGFLACGKSVEKGFQICLLKILVCLPSRLGQGKQDIWPLDIGGGTFPSTCIIPFARKQCTHFVAPKFVMGLLNLFQQLLA